MHAPIGLIANPHAAQDVRRLTTLGRVVPVETKANLTARLLAGLGSDGPTVLALDDSGGIARRAARLAAGACPPVRFVPIRATATVHDTLEATELMRQEGVGWIATVGGDGTARAVAQAWPDVSLAPVAAGTNNAIALDLEPTVVGRALAIATSDGIEGRPISLLEVATADGLRRALVDAVVAATPWVGAGALWEPEALEEAVVVNAHAAAVGIASIAARFDLPDPAAGLHLVFGVGGTPVDAVFAPGRVETIPVRRAEVLPVGAEVTLASLDGVIALDGERMAPAVGAVIRVDLGPKVLEPRKILQSRKVDPRAVESGHLDA